MALEQDKQKIHDEAVLAENELVINAQRYGPFHIRNYLTFPILVFSKYGC
jgi:hypothetical protein